MCNIELLFELWKIWSLLSRKIKKLVTFKKCLLFEILNILMKERNALDLVRKDNKTKAKNFPYATRISSLKLVFIVFFKTN